MIARKVSTQSARRGDFAGLVKYILNDQGKHERVGHVAVSNCHSDVPDVAILEVLNTQALNTRATACKTYHLIVSFRAGEQPDAATLAAIEARCCDALGFADHQRVSAVHHDTDNLHMHIAINKIHPTRYTIHDPYRDHKTLATCCTTLERDYGLQADCHQPRKSLAENRAHDMEHQAGVESLLGWIQRGCLSQIRAATSWAELHKVMRTHGLTLHARGNGLVITADAGTSVKASSIDRTCSKAKLEARLGMFEASPEFAAGEKPARQYTQKAMPSSVDTSALFARYQREQHAARTARSTNLQRSRARKGRRIDSVKRIGRLRRAAIKLISAPRLEKKILYALSRNSQRAALANIALQHRKECQRIMDGTQRLAWVAWLRSTALAGDPDAIAALRARDNAPRSGGSTPTGMGRRPNGQTNADADQPSLQHTAIKESTHAATERRRTAERSPVRSEPVAPATGKTHQHNPARIGTSPPPAGRHGLRSLSELDVVRLGDRGEVLLPRDVPRHLAQHGAAADHGMRRRVAGAGQVGVAHGDSVAPAAPIKRKAKGHHR